MVSYLSLIHYQVLFVFFVFCPETGYSSSVLCEDVIPTSSKDFVNLHAEQMGGEVVLDLQFNPDIKIDSFWIERSDDGLIFRKVIQKTNLDTSTNFYRIFDKLPPIKKEESYVYYKVRMFRLAGQVEVSDIGGLMLRKPQKWQVKLQSDSTNRYLQVDVSAPQKERIEVRVSDGGRRMYAIERVELHMGFNRLLIDISDWPQQFYFVNVKTKAHFERRNFVKY